MNIFLASRPCLVCRIHFFAILRLAMFDLCQHSPINSHLFLHPDINQRIFLFRLSVDFRASALNRASTEFISMEYRFRVRVIFVFPYVFFSTRLRFLVRRTYSRNAERHRKNLYEICFHAKRAATRARIVPIQRVVRALRMRVCQTKGKNI